MEDVEGIRDEQEVDVVEEENNESAVAEGAESPESRSPKEPKKFVATVQEVHEAFDAVNTLRYSQPTHLQGNARPASITNEIFDNPNFQESAKV